MGNNNLMVSGTPHIRSNETITSIMRDVVIALCCNYGYHFLWY